jgi:hypothetical protein
MRIGVDPGDSTTHVCFEIVDALKGVERLEPKFR